MAAGNYDIVIDQGADFALSIALSEDGDAINLSTHTVSAQLRPTPSSNTLTATFTCSITNAALGKLTMNLGYALTANIAAGKYKISRSLYFYIKHAHVGTVPGIAEFVKEFTSENAFGENGYLLDKGLIPLPDADRKAIRADGKSLKKLVM